MYYLSSLIDRGAQWAGRGRFGPRGVYGPTGSPIVTDYAQIRLQGAQSGACILWTPDALADTTGLILLGDDPLEPVATTSRTALLTLSNDGRTLPATLGEALADLIIRKLPTSDRPNVRTQRNGRLTIKIGRTTLYDQQVEPERRASIKFSDDFTGDGNINGRRVAPFGLWQETVGTAWLTTGGVASCTGHTASTTAQVNANLETDDMQVFGDLTTTLAAGTTIEASLIARGTGAAGANAGYAGIFANVSSTTTARLEDRVTDVELASTSIAAASGTMELKVDGSSLTLYRNSSEILTDSDTAITAIVRGGILSFSDNAGNTATVDNFIIQDVGFTGGYPVVAAKTSAGIVSAVLSLTKPTGVTVGETLVIFVGSDDDTDTANWDNVTNKPAGFTLIRTAGSATIDAHIAAFWKIADGTESAVASIPKGGGSDDYWGAYLRITGAHETTPIHNTGSTTFAAATVSATFAPVTTSTGSCLLLFGVSYDGSDATYSVNTANDWAELMTVIVGSASAAGGCGLIAARQATTASTNTGPAVSFGLSDGVVAYTIAIAPAAGAVAAFNPYPVIWQNYRNMGIM